MHATTIIAHAATDYGHDFARSGAIAAWAAATSPDPVVVWDTSTLEAIGAVEGADYRDLRSAGGLVEHVLGDRETITIIWTPTHAAWLWGDRPEVARILDAVGAIPRVSLRGVDLRGAESVVEAWMTVQRLGTLARHYPGGISGALASRAPEHYILTEGGELRRPKMWPGRYIHRVRAGAPAAQKVDTRLIMVGMDRLPPRVMAERWDAWEAYWDAVAERPDTVGSSKNPDPVAAFVAFLRGVPAFLYQAAPRTRDGYARRPRTLSEWRDAKLVRAALWGSRAVIESAGGIARKGLRIIGALSPRDKALVLHALATRQEEWRVATHATVAATVARLPELRRRMDRVRAVAAAAERAGYDAARIARILARAGWREGRTFYGISYEGWTYGPVILGDDLAGLRIGPRPGEFTGRAVRWLVTHGRRVTLTAAQVREALESYDYRYDVKEQLAAFATATGGAIDCEWGPLVAEGIYRARDPWCWVCEGAGLLPPRDLYPRPSDGERW